MLTLAVDDRTPVRAPAPVGACNRILTATCLGCPNCLHSGRVLDQAERKRTAR